MPPKKIGTELSDEEIASAELRTQIKDIYDYLRKISKNKMPPKQKYTTGKLETLKSNLKSLELMQRKYETDMLKDRIGILYNRFIKYNVPLPETLGHCISIVHAVRHCMSCCCFSSRCG